MSVSFAKWKPELFDLGPPGDKILGDQLSFLIQSPVRRSKSGKERQPMFKGENTALGVFPFLYVELSLPS
jgi:hypothetical protein